MLLACSTWKISKMGMRDTKIRYVTDEPECWDKYLDFVIFSLIPQSRQVSFLSIL
jgi:hypothetical protein